MKLKFLGATGTVTGSKYLLEAGNKRVLIDCGLFQGLKELRLRNWDKFPLDPKSIDAVVLTHAHIDHSGYLPSLIRQGFRGPIFSTSATRDLCKILLPDSGKLQEEEARYANKRGYSKHHPALPLYTKEEGEMAIQYFNPIAFGEEARIAGPLSVRFSPAGHILGSASALIHDGARSVLFSGDVGRPHDLIMNPPATGLKADYLVVESTYGDRTHEPTDPLKQLESVIERTVRRRGVVIVPAFAVGRSQAILYAIYLLKKEGRIADVPVYLNSPMSVNTMGLYCDHKREHRLSDDECRGLCEVAKYVNTVEESKALNNKSGPMVIISASGMATGGRVLHHLKTFAPDAKNTILLSGYQAAGTRGEALAHGAKSIKIHGEQVPVNAEVAMMDNYSAHADRNEIASWLRTFQSAPRMTYLTHGEPSSARSLGELIEKTLNWKTTVPEYLQEVELK